MIFFKFQDSFLLKWADRLFDEHSQSWKDGPKHFFQNIGGISALKSNQTVSKFKGVELIDSPFWKRVLITWLNYKNLDLDKAVLTLKLNDPIFNNILVTYRNNTLFSSQCIKKNKQQKRTNKQTNKQTKMSQ